MPILSFTLSAEHAKRLEDAICGLHEYGRMEFPDIEKPKETRQEFAKKIIKEWLVTQVRNWEREKALQEAVKTISTIIVE